MMKFDIVLIFFFLINSSLSLQSSDLCSTQENYCRLGERDGQTIECRRKACSGEYNFKCGDKHCALDEESCSSFLFLNHSLKALMLPKVGRGHKFENRSRVFKILVANIRPCVWMRLSKWKPVDVCMSGKRCYLKQRLPVRYNYLNIFNLIKCPCQSSLFKYECGDSFCARDKIACDGFLVFNSTSELSQTKFNSCQNDNLTLKI